MNTTAPATRHPSPYDSVRHHLAQFDWGDGREGGIPWRCRGPGRVKEPHDGLDRVDGRLTGSPACEGAPVPGRKHVDSPAQVTTGRRRQMWAPTWQEATLTDDLTWVIGGEQVLPSPSRSPRRARVTESRSSYNERRR